MFSEFDPDISIIAVGMHFVISTAELIVHLGECNYSDHLHHIPHDHGPYPLNLQSDWSQINTVVLITEH